MKSTCNAHTPRRFDVRPILCLAAILFATSLGNQAMADDLPTGEQVFEKFLEKTGGKKAQAAVKTRVMKMKMTQMGQEGSGTVYHKAPNKFAMELQSPMMGTIQSGYDGETGWSMNPMTGTQVMTGESAEQFKKQSKMFPDMDWRDSYEKVECVELTDFNGEKCYKVECTDKNGGKEMRFFSKESGLLAGSEQTMQGMGIQSTFSDYKKVGDITYAHKMTQSVQGMDGMGSDIVFESIEHNVDLADDKFMPAEVAAKVAAEKKSGDDDKADDDGDDD